ncbi:hypothetical protein K443DRAFT_6607 [Laccaria amethystina LaAM-08-1]|uniref:Uncharacterized protein n=1 Tax=Laccaria amethystina LaAM-08-1 TaxID=1095629 RepID=A0A0C9XW23_9AGAR|nr:hypothetical protein K443DRAFT_6607 [Laccaria amethystina LaAM-08-1]
MSPTAWPHHITNSTSTNVRTTTRPVPSGRAASSDGDDIPNIVTICIVTNHSTTPQHGMTTTHPIMPNCNDYLKCHVANSDMANEQQVLLSFIIIQAQVPHCCR